jgi:cobalt transport protein ATP-binding subunit
MTAAIEMQDLSYAYPDGHVALRNVNLIVGAGERVGLVGPNGAGKSTLLLHLNGLLAGTGRVLVAGMSLSDGNLPHVRRKVGLVFQEADDQLFSPTVFEDVAYGPIYQGMPSDEVEKRVAGALSKVGLEGFERRAPYHLSVGEKRRVSLATVLAMEPEILVLDEPSSGLDPRGRRGLINLLRGLPQTILVATHDMLLVRELLPRTVIMDGGAIVADGPTERLLRDEVLMERHGLEASDVAGTSTGKE